MQFSLIRPHESTILQNSESKFEHEQFSLISQSRDEMQELVQ